MRQGVIGGLALALVAVAAAAEKPSFVWKEPRIGAGAFSDALGMLDREREEYAENLATYAINQVSRAKASTASLEQGRRFLALSLHLAPRNKRALVANYQLNRAVIPEPVEADYSPEVLARLLFTRAQVLRKQGGPENTMLSRFFIEVAAELDPRNEDAVYASEIQRLDQGRLDWSMLTDVRDDPEEPAADDAEAGGSDLP